MFIEQPCQAGGSDSTMNKVKTKALPQREGPRPERDGYDDNKLTGHRRAVCQGEKCRGINKERRGGKEFRVRASLRRRYGAGQEVGDEAAGGPGGRMFQESGANTCRGPEARGDGFSWGWQE